MPFQHLFTKSSHSCTVLALVLNGPIKKNNMKTKNKELDKWITKIRSPYERVFSKTRKRVRYIGVVKNQFSAFMEAIAFNFKRSAVLAQQAYS